MITLRTHPDFFSQPPASRDLNKRYINGNRLFNDLSKKKNPNAKPRKANKVWLAFHKKNDLSEYLNKHFKLFGSSDWKEHARPGDATTLLISPYLAIHIARFLTLHSDSQAINDWLEAGCPHKFATVQLEIDFETRVDADPRNAPSLRPIPGRQPKTDTSPRTVANDKATDVRAPTVFADGDGGLLNLPDVRIGDVDETMIVDGIGTPTNVVSKPTASEVTIHIEHVGLDSDTPRLEPTAGELDTHCAEGDDDGEEAIANAAIETTTIDDASLDEVVATPSREEVQHKLDVNPTVVDASDEEIMIPNAARATVTTLAPGQFERNGRVQDNLDVNTIVARVETNTLDAEHEPRRMEINGKADAELTRKRAQEEDAGRERILAKARKLDDYELQEKECSLSLLQLELQQKKKEMEIRVAKLYQELETQKNNDAQELERRNVRVDVYADVYADEDIRRLCG
ncbi:hypothetical protein CYMTET_6176 [Cymbomonas tetramitiformis]|uniref:Uncharacterized protein n=1 Tax=Cymbomonas tetramitiformis TaxID=36881 RepID=A0AAE0GY09_9CHLO|nr:hypothetical protein CYMTET_6176 [Cymbomonas tetramitiformis]